MVQILPPVPTFGSRLAEALGTAVGKYAEGAEKRRVSTNDKRILDMASDESLTPFQRANLYAQLSQPKLQALGPTLAALSKAGIKEQADINKADIYRRFLDEEKPSVPQATTPLQGATGADMRPATPSAEPNADMQNVGEIMEEEQPPFSKKRVKKAFADDKDLGKFMQAENEAFERKKEAKQRAALDKQKFEETKRHHETGEKLAIHETTKKYAEGLDEDTKRAHNTLKAVKSVRGALAKHKTGFTWENFFKKQFAGTFLENLPLTKEGAIIEANIPAFLEGMRDLFGQRLSDADLAVVLGKTVDLGKSNEANEAILDLAEMGAEIALKKELIASEIVKKNGGYRPIDFKNQVNAEFDKRYGDEVDQMYRSKIGPKSSDIEMVNPKNGKPMFVPPEKVEFFLEKGAKLK